jgi:hypothetical protein
MKAKREHPDYNKKQLCALIGVTDSSLKRIMKDLDIKSFYRHEIPVNKPKTNKNEETKKKKDTKSHKTKRKEDIEDEVEMRRKKDKHKGAEKKGSESRISKPNRMKDEISDEYIDKLIS